MSNNPRMDKWLQQHEEGRRGIRRDNKNQELTPVSESRDHIYGYNTVSVGHVHYVGFWRRLFAYIVDSLILGIFLYTVDNFWVLLLINILYFSILTSSSLQGTIGKIAIGAIVVDKSGNRISFLRGLARYFGYILSAIPLAIGFLMIAFHGKKKSLHDMICETMVINK
ncbi:RDD family protein [Virgibacillus sp. DJP39]|uniref:RDD family protein n=1 Tax=Virgibacillus sp. DJP39 TaxID=3409790 RepID=UPI003BB7679D